MYLGHVERLTAGQLAFGARGGDPIPGSLGDQSPLEMGDGPDHMEDEFAASRRCVDLFLQTPARTALAAYRLARAELFGHLTATPHQANHRPPFSPLAIGPPVSQH